MSVNLEDYFHTVFEEQLRNVCVQEEDMRTSASRLLDKHRDIKHMDALLKTHTQEFEIKKNSIRQRRDELKIKEEKLKDSLMKFDKFLKENDAKRARGLRKSEAERAAVREREQEVMHLNRKLVDLQVEKKTLEGRVQRYSVYWSFLQRVLHTSMKDVGQLISRVETLLCTRQQLLERASEVERERERESGEQRRYVGERASVLLHYNNSLSHLQTQLDTVLSQALRWESTWSHIQATAAKETLLLGQIKVSSLNLYHMTGGVTGGAQGVSFDDTLEQLERIRLYIQNRADVIRDLRSDADSGSIRASDHE